MTTRRQVLFATGGMMAASALPALAGAAPDRFARPGLMGVAATGIPDRGIDGRPPRRVVPTGPQPPRPPEQQAAAQAGGAPGGPPGAPQGGGGFPRGRRDDVEYVEYCHSLGAAGVQMQISDPVRLRRRLEELGMFLEVEVQMPITREDTTDFERQVLQAKEAGARTVRGISLNARRYEIFKTMAEYQAWERRTTGTVEAAVPICEKHRMKLSMENHKDRTADEFAALLKRISSEYYGAMIDFGNNIALCDEPMELVQKLGPYINSTHVKDMGVQRYQDGFLLSEVVIGDGFLDIAGMMAACRRHNPNVYMSLEMITRDPLRVPVLTDGYWVTYPERRATRQRLIMDMVDKNASQKPLPVVSGMTPEARAALAEDNIKRCIAWAKARQA